MCGVGLTKGGTDRRLSGASIQTSGRRCSSDLAPRVLARPTTVESYSQKGGDRREPVHITTPVIVAERVNGTDVYLRDGEKIVT